ncbi:hypothetical protein G5C51_21805 [Streptomyces sp. A7024]|uniref:Uncharacterized protein n=1 Tax=Streptomyces coryli TaxID=1128680 RepID=A0A6G4U2S0_9ACTN|nr:ATP-binding protein [Streptomyces coryli]NGN66525.1 hypothetical protein [Streptomyces coryli]
MTTAQEYVALLRELKTFSGLTYRELAVRAERAGDVLPRSTIAGLLGSSRLPRGEPVAALVRACGGGPEEVAAWLRAHQRLAGRAGRTGGGQGAGEAGRTQLPPATADFIGRQDEVAVIRRRLTAERGPQSPGPALVAVSGPAGTGKSALAVHCAHLLGQSFPDGRLYADLGGAGAGTGFLPDVLAGLLRGLGVTAAELPGGEAERLELYRTLTATRRVLVVLDNADAATGGDTATSADAAAAADTTTSATDAAASAGVAANAADAANATASATDPAASLSSAAPAPAAAAQATARLRPLLPAGPGCAALVTSRRRLALEGAHAVDLGELGLAAGVRLLAATAGPGPVAAAPVAARRLVELCGRLPLALRIAGARLRTRPHWSVERLLDHLADERHRLDGLTYSDLSVRDALARDGRGLSPAAVHALHVLGLKAPPRFTVWQAAALLVTGTGEAEELLEELTDSRLLTALGPHYRIPPLVRLYARELAATDPTPAALLPARTSA